MTEIYDVPAAYRRRRQTRRRIAIGIPASLTVFIAGTLCAKWGGNYAEEPLGAVSARQVLADGEMTMDNHRVALLVVHRDTVLNIRAVNRIIGEGGPLASDAEKYLKRIQEEIR